MKTKISHFRLWPAQGLQHDTLPGTLRPVHNSDPGKITLFTFTADNPKPVASLLNTLTDLPKIEQIKANQTHWLRVIGLGDMVALKTIGEFYNLNAMALEDVVSLGHRSKMEEIGDYLFFVLQIPPNQPGEHTEHVTAFLRSGLLITFEAKETNALNHLLYRCETGSHISNISHKAGFLLYNLIDLSLDSFFPILDKKAAMLESLEETLTSNYPNQDGLNQLHNLKRELLALKRVLWPYKDLSASLLLCHNLSAIKELKPFLGDLRDHVLQAMDLAEAYHDIADALDDLCQSAISNRTNDIMKVLTIISTIFMPLSFLAGVYGMNFNPEVSPFNMPELQSKYGYLALLGVMGFIAGGMILFFKRRDWL